MPCTYTQTRVNMAGEKTEIGTNCTDRDCMVLALAKLDLTEKVTIKVRPDGTIALVTDKNAKQRKEDIVKTYCEVKVEKEARRRGYVLTKTRQGDKTILTVNVKGRG